MERAHQVETIVCENDSSRSVRVVTIVHLRLEHLCAYLQEDVKVKIQPANDGPIYGESVPPSNYCNVTILTPQRKGVVKV